MSIKFTDQEELDILDAWELTPDEQAEFDYLNWAAIEAGTDSAWFFRYRGGIYDLGDMEGGWGGAPKPFPGWDTYKSDTFFSGIVVRYGKNDDEDDVLTVARYYAS